MTDPFNDLEEQLRRRVSERSGASNVASASRSRRWRRSGLLALAAALTISGGAIAATTIHNHAINAAGRSIARRAAETGDRSPVCRPEAPNFDRPTRYSTTPVLPVIANAVPLVTSPIGTASASRTVRRLAHGGTVITSSEHVVRGRGMDLVAWVELGDGYLKLSDPAGCTALRLAAARKLADDRSAAIQAAAANAVRTAPDVNPQTQMLTIGFREHGSINGHSRGAFAGMPIVPDAPFPLRPFSMAMSGGSTFVGVITTPGAARIKLRPRHRVAGLPRSIPVHGGLWLLAPPTGTGPIHMTAVTAAGTPLRKLMLR